MMVLTNELSNNAFPRSAFHVKSTSTMIQN